MWLRSSNTLTRATLLICSSLLTGCVGPILSGAEMVYERYELKQTWQDAQLVSQGNKILQRNRGALRKCHVVLTAFNRDLVLIGQVPSGELKAFVARLMKPLTNKRRLFNELTIGAPTGQLQRVQDAWITTKVRSQMLLDNRVNQKKFKVVTEDSVVYVLGDVKQSQANVVVSIARNTKGVRKVVRVFRYYHYQDSV